jgi:hypothetical protein
MLPFHVGVGVTAGGELGPLDELDSSGRDGDTVDERIPLDIVDKYDSLLPDGSTDDVFGDQLVIAYDFLLVS